MADVLRFLLGRIDTIVAVFIGAVVTLWVTHRYYVRAAKALSEAIRGLHKLTTLIIRGLEEADLAKFTRDKDGIPVGLTLQVFAKDEVRLRATSGDDKKQQPPK